MHGFRPWFYAAAIYNVVWGLLAVLFPLACFRLAGMEEPLYPWLFQCIGMMVGVFAIGYWLLARDPVRFGPIIWIAILGKLFGPIGFVWVAARGGAPWEAGLMILFNDVVWLPAFVLFALRARGTRHIITNGNVS